MTSRSGRPSSACRTLPLCCAGRPSHGRSPDMLGIDDAVTAVSSVIGKVIDRAIPDPAQAAAAKLELLKEDNQQALRLVQSDLSAVMAEAQSADKWTSRARPSFLYVIYAMILLSVPIGIVYAIH